MGGEGKGGDFDSGMHDCAAHALPYAEMFRAGMGASFYPLRGLLNIC